jgi:hypothetical protein
MNGYPRTISGLVDINADTVTGDNGIFENFTIGDLIITDISLNTLTVSGAASFQNVSMSGTLNVSGLSTLAEASINSRITFRNNAIICHNTSDGSDTRYLLLTGGGEDLSTRGGRIVLSGNERAGHEGKVQVFAGATGTIEFLTNGDTLRGSFNSAGLMTLTAGLTVSAGTTTVGTLTSTDRINVKNTSWTTNGDDIFIASNNNWIHLRPEPASGGKGQYYITLNAHAWRNNANTDMFILNKDTNASTWINGSALSVGTSGTTSSLTVYGSGSFQNGLTVTSGATSTQALTVNTTLNVSGTSTLGLTVIQGTLQFNSNAIVSQNTADGSDNRFTILTGGGADGSSRGGRIVLSGNERVSFGGNVELYAGGSGEVQFFTGNDTLRGFFNTSGLLTLNNGLTIAIGQTLNVGTSGTTSPLNVFGLITGNNGLTISSGNTSVQAFSCTSFTGSGALVSSDTTATTSSTTGAIRTPGGISSDNATDAVSSTNGGSGTFKGGFAIGKKLFTGETITSGQSIVIGQGGSQAEGSIYSDANWGMLFRAKQASPAAGEFRFANSANTDLLTIGAVTISTPQKIRTTNTTEYTYISNDGAIRSDGGIRAAKGIFAVNGFYTTFGKGLYLDSNWTNTKMIETENGKVGYLANDATYLYSAGGSSGSGANPVIGYNTTSVRNYNTTQSSSITTGAAIIDGGLGVAKTVYVGENINVAGNMFGGARTSFTPTIFTDTTITYTTQAGFYYRLGPMVFINLTIVTTSVIAVGAVNLAILSLPFNNGGTQETLWTISYENYELPSGTDSVVGRTQIGFNSIDILASRDNLTRANLVAPTTSATRRLTATGWYFTS